MKFLLTIVDYQNSGFWVLRLFSPEMVNLLKTEPVLEKMIATADIDLYDGVDTLSISQLLIKLNQHNYSLIPKDGSVGIGLNMKNN